MELKPIGGRMWKTGAGEERPQEMEVLKGALEAMLFVSGEPVPTRRLAEALDCDEGRVVSALQELSEEYQAENRGIQLRSVGGGWRLHTHPAYASYVEKMLLTTKRARLTRAAVETLAIIAYLQPITRSQIANLRGVQSENVVKVLVDMGLVAEAGKEKAPGGPALYVTTEKFLERFGLHSLEELPPLEDFEPDRETVERIARSLSGHGETREAGAGAVGTGVPRDSEAGELVIPTNAVDPVRPSEAGEKGGGAEGAGFREQGRARAGSEAEGMAGEEEG